MKVCPTCNKDETLTRFRPRMRDCVPCIYKRQNERKRAIRAANKKPKKNAKKREYDACGILVKRECCTCKNMLPLNKFNKNPSHGDGYNNVCRDCAKSKWKETVDDKRVMYLLQRLKSKSKQIGVPFNLDPGDITVPDTCPVLGIPLRFGKQGDEPGWRDNSPSVDRIIPSVGYVKGNVIVISYRANRIKNDATIEELDKVATFFKSVGEASNETT